jgi:heat shock protein HslJ
VEPRGYKIYFGAIAATRIACPNMEVEQQFLEVLNQKEVGYKIDDAKLELVVGEKVVMVFERGE